MLRKILTFSFLATYSTQLPSSSIRLRCRYGDDCWPSQQAWHSFNESISGQLMRTLPSAAVCHSQHLDEANCVTAEQEWTNSFWRTNQTGAYTAIAWELGSDQCFINVSSIDKCGQGLVPYYSVVATKVDHVQTAVKFAGERDLYFVVKNTGHDHLGRSSGRNGFSIWTHLLKGREWHDSFVPMMAPKTKKGVPAVTLQAGEQWIDVYRDASKRHRIVHGGGARTVGTSGGWLTGGGHGPFSHFYGLGVDNLLEATLVNTQGEHVTLNEYNDPEYFWALRGGGGSTWGVITSVTYQTHPEPAHIQLVLGQANATEISAVRPLFEHSLCSLVNMTDAGYVGYGYFTKDQFSFIMIQPNGTNLTYQQGFSTFEEANDIPGVTAYTLPMVLPSWIDYVDNWLTDPNIAQNVMDASRLITPDVLLSPQKLVDLMMNNPVGDPAFNFIGKVNASTRDSTSVHPVWRDSRAVMSFGVNWNDTDSPTVKHQRMLDLVATSKKLGEVVGPNGGTYVNEANPFEPDWQEVFWGANYEKLLQIKKTKDPRNLFVCNRCVGSDINFEPW